MDETVSRMDKVRAFMRVARYRPLLSAGVVTMSMVAAVLEGVGLSFLIPILEQVRSGGGQPTDAGGVLGMFFRAYEFVGVPFTLEYIVLGVGAVMFVRFTASFFVAWLQAALQTDYIRHLQTQLFDRSLAARITYFDTRGSDEILNAIVTQASYAGRSIRFMIRILEQGLVSLVYLAIAMFLAPVLTLATAVLLGGAVFFIRYVFESGYDVGDRVAEANERIQVIVQAGTQGIRDVKLFGMADELFESFKVAVDTYAESEIRLQRNKAALGNFYQLTVSITVFALIYFAVTLSSLTLSSLGVFLFAMFRLGPKLSALNDYVYEAEATLPHLVRTQLFLADLEAHKEVNPATRELPKSVSTVCFDDVRFHYDSDEPTIDGVSLSVDRDEFIAFVGPSGAGKSTIVGLLTRMYEVDGGAIRADGIPIDEVDIDEWRSRLSVVRQNPYIFNDTLRYNVTVGNRDVSRSRLEHACQIAQVTEFFDELPDGYDTVLGDDGVRLSGGQRQRIAIARALLEDADIIVFDEATSDLDTKLERKVHTGIEEMNRDYALVVIAHRLSTVTNADRIYGMEAGKITERGSHEELLRKDGNYASLYSIQT